MPIFLHQQHNESNCECSIIVVVIASSVAYSDVHTKSAFRLANTIEHKNDRQHSFMHM